MALKMENVITSFVIMGGLLFVFSMFYNGLDSEYGFQTEQQTVMQQLEEKNLIGGFNELYNGLYQLKNPSDLDDILGGLKSSGIGFMRAATGIITFPLDIIGIYTGFFSIPNEVSLVLGTIIIIYMGFLILNLYIDR